MKPTKEFPQFERALKDFKKVSHDKEIKDSMIITVLKRHGLRGDVALGYYNNPEYPIGRLIKTVWLFRYIKSTGYEVANDTAFFNVLLKESKYPIPDEFWDYVKQHQSNYDGKDFEILYRAF